MTTQCTVMNVIMLKTRNTNLLKKETAVISNLSTVRAVLLIQLLAQRVMKDMNLLLQALVVLMMCLTVKLVLTLIPVINVKKITL